MRPYGILQRRRRKGRRRRQIQLHTTQAHYGIGGLLQETSMALAHITIFVLSSKRPKRKQDAKDYSLLCVVLQVVHDLVMSHDSALAAALT